ncbi:Sugar-binding periplasmic protein [Acidilobus saccharovorans 345-15]|uniref:Sugar-binding periplasmic protein n=1 Tax=Acidilobus saccharovorans (strain DSM 16705 / JCM 18335 / VKM B-2471 / 345-15) TaxID=666510 RepID=D9Q161_ACIS3|nr:glucose ABC transporter substrate-binding protein GlcS [Acidilobus saccharovorans]ADL19049.1 Sugar-binding periplasmic protein [Acidilobus saccharovorans 345-15]
MRSSLSTAAIAAIVIVIVVVAAVGGYLAYVSTRHHVTTTTPTTTTTSVTTPITTTTTTTVTTITFYTWWATTGRVALDHLIPAFEAAYPQYTVQKEIIPGAGGTNARYAIMGMIIAGRPPDLFQSLLGANMLSYAEAAPQGVKAFLNLTPALKSMGFLNPSVVSLPIIEAAAYNGTTLNAPVSVHSGFVLYINMKVLRQYNLPLPTNMSTLIYDTVQLAEHGVTPWMVPGADGGYDQEQLWFAIFLSLGGPRLLDEVLYGTVNFSSPTFWSVFNETNRLFLNFTSYNYPAWRSMTWSQGIADVALGKAVFEVDVDSATNYLYDFDNITVYPATEPYISWPNVTVVAEPFPGTQDYFVVVSDAVAIPVSPYQEAALTFMKYWLSYSGQQAWTRWKAVTYYLNGTDWYNTPQQWWMYQHLVNLSRTAPQNFVIDPLSLFADTDETIYSGLLALQSTGPSYLQGWTSMFENAMHEECEEWLTGAKMGLGYLGLPGEPFGGYVPPWVNPSTFTFTSNYTCLS